MHCPANYGRVGHRKEAFLSRSYWRYLIGGFVSARPAQNAVHALPVLRAPCAVQPARVEAEQRPTGADIPHATAVGKHDRGLERVRTGALNSAAGLRRYVSSIVLPNAKAKANGELALAVVHFACTIDFKIMLAAAALVVRRRC
ncbi:hypothetical protein DFH27DRAFT_529570 [Peziza echinospora]|nr:hypothetical protein DFH27DRAFT_529570 [Peziza echinospora]